MYVLYMLLTITTIRIVDVCMHHKYSMLHLIFLGTEVVAGTANFVKW